MSALTDALAKARKEMKMPPMNGVGHAGRNGSREYRYALLSDVLKCVVPPLLENGVFLYQGIRDGVLETVVMMGDESLTLDSRRVNLSGTSQEQGSAETYAKRYALCTAFCIAGLEDDDGQAATDAANARGSAPADNRAEQAKRRMWEAMKRYAELHGMEPTEVANGVKKRPDFAETAEFYTRVAEEFEAECHV